MTISNIITRNDFIGSKKSDVFVIYGCGYSINDLTHEQKHELAKHDSIGFNWFCFSGIPTTHYLIREQAVCDQIGRETRKELVDTLAKRYSSTIALVSNLRTSTANWARGFDWAKSVRVIKNRAAIVNEAPGKRLWKKLDDRQRMFCDYAAKYDPFVHGLLYDFCTMTSILHMARFMQYREIVFAGVDLYDHRYFWLRPDQLRETTRAKGRKLNVPHHVAKYTIRLVSTYAKCFSDTKLSVVNPKSLLADVIPVWSPNAPS